MGSLKCEDTPRKDKEETFFSWKLHIGMVWIFLDNYTFIRPENLKISPGPYLENYSNI